MKTIADLRHDIDLAERELLCADMIDNGARRETELAYWRGRMKDARRALAEADVINLQGSGPAEIDPREER